MSSAAIGLNRPPVLQHDPELRESDVVAEYQQALAAGDVEAIVAAFEPDGYAREPSGGEYVHRGQDALRAFYEHLFSNGGGIPLAKRLTRIPPGERVDPVPRAPPAQSGAPLRRGCGKHGGRGGQSAARGPAGAAFPLAGSWATRGSARHATVLSTATHGGHP